MTAFDVVSQNSAAVFGSPVQNGRVIGAAEAGVLDPQDIHTGVEPQDSPHDAVVEVLIGEKGYQKIELSFF